MSEYTKDDIFEDALGWIDGREVDSFRKAYYDAPIGDTRKQRKQRTCPYCHSAKVLIPTRTANSLAALNERNELVVNVEGGQAEIPIKFCPLCGRRI